jgi:hypothetical protein
MINKNDFFFNEKEKKWFFRALVGGGIVIASLVIITIVILTISSASKTAATAAQKPPEPVVAEKPGELTKPIALYSFIIPQPEHTVTDPAFRLSRVRLPAWDKAMVDRFWADPAEIGLKALAEKNKKAAETLLESIP